ncbi:transposase [Sulfurovum sp. TSL1]|uniref:transposase n=1 Tax=Sulfurovum sp. TSL1 TaxID=2826994 RepID=UPI001CC3D55A|nr:transposase [Sulfurovum sp. TSL1]GIT98348.1 hypothetical protein TSL1_11690 [Sulfurovum sp. TSL1]
MTVKNKYVKSSHISERKFRESVKYFSEDLNATQILNLIKISRPTTNKYLKAFDADSIIHYDGWCGYHGLVDLGYDKYFRVHHGANKFVRGKSHFNGIESFWSYAKIRLAKFRGLDKKSFILHLKECEVRFNHRGEDLYKFLLKIFRKESLKLS